MHGLLCLSKRWILRGRKINKIIFILGVMVTSQSYADNYTGVYRCHSHGVDWESATKCPPAATPTQSGMNFNNYRMDDEKKSNPYARGNRPSVFAIKERYKGYRDDLRFNNVRNGDQNYLKVKIAELNRYEQIELNNAR